MEDAVVGFGKAELSARSWLPVMPGKEGGGSEEDAVKKRLLPSPS